MTWIVVALGGALGSLARHGVNHLVAGWLSRPSPVSTALVNLAGAGIIGLLAGLSAAGHLPLTPTLRSFVFVGILGGFTTFSSFMLDALTLMHGGQGTVAAVNLVGQLVAGVALVWGGYALGASFR